MGCPVHEAIRKPSDQQLKPFKNEVILLLTSILSSLTCIFFHRLSFYLTGKRPDHAAGHHFLVPEFAETSDREAAAAEAIKVAKRKMQGLNNSVFEELCVDVYDEVDRRETDQVRTIVM